MEAHNVVKEGLGDKACRIRMAQRDEVSEFREPIDHCQDNRLTTHLWKPLDEIHSDVTRDLAWNWQRLEKSNRMKVLSLILLAHHTTLHEVTHVLSCIWAIECCPKSVEGLLAAFMAHCMGPLQYVWP
jgi:hypothetical protein